MRFASIALTALLALSACGSSSDSEGSPAKSKAEGPDSVTLWSLCADHAKDEVSGSWKFPYPSDAKVTKDGPGWKVTGSAQGPADQTFTLSCSYKDVTDEGATRTAYSLE